MEDAKQAIESLSQRLEVDKSFDLIRRDIIVGERRSALFFVDGFIKDEVFEKIMEFLFKRTPQELANTPDMDVFMRFYMPYVEVDAVYDLDQAETAVLSGQTVLMIEGIRGALLIDVRTYPMRGIEEPEKDRTMRGSRDGFVETLVMNTALIRRRIRDRRLRMEYKQLGSTSKVDLSIAYMEGIADEKTLNNVRKRLEKIKVRGLSMTLEAVSEVLCPTAFFNPFPRIKFTERPDYASACLMEGKIVLVIDNSPSVMILPTSFADFTKDADDYYFPPLTGTYVRLSRLIVSLATVLLTPVFLMLVNNEQWIPQWLDFIRIEGELALPLLAQFLILEFVIDGLRLASLNTPSTLSNSLGIIGALLLSEFAIDTGWFVPESILYMAFVAIASFAQPSFEMGYAMKFTRIFLLILVQLFGFWGLIGGLAAVLLLMGFSKTVSGFGYLYPIIPFKWQAFKKLFVRTKIEKSH